jgi:hypothetical protein
MAVYNIGDTFTNGFFVIQTPTTPNNNTGLYNVSNTVGIQYFVTGATLNGYDLVGNYNSGGSNSGSSSGSTTVIVIHDPNLLPGSPFVQIPPGTASGTNFVISASSGSMVRLVNLSDQGQPAMLVGYDNPSTASGRILFAQSLNAQQIVDINVRTYFGITVALVGAPTNSDYGVNVVNDIGGQSLLTGYDYQPIPVSQTTPVIVHAGGCTMVGLRNNSGLNQQCTFVGYDNASTTSGRILFRQQLQAGQSVDIRETAFFGITVAMTGGATNSDYGVNVLYASTSS